MPVRPSLRATLATAAVVLTTSTLTLAVQRVPRRPDPKPQYTPPAAVKAPGRPTEPSKPVGQLPDDVRPPVPPTDLRPGLAEVQADFDQRLVEASTTPRPQPPIPDSPPPHEGAMIVIPYVVEPPDLLRIEVLEAAPGRPITGQDRLVMPNGKINLEFYGDVGVVGLTTDQIKTKVILHLRRFLSDVALGLVKVDETGEVIKDGRGRPLAIAPYDSDKVFVEVSGYNSKVYYVQGEVSLPGRLPWVGNETVLDALNYAGGFVPTADPKNIRVVRPARGKAPAKVYHVDYEAIVVRGDPTTNYQLFPGDRIFVDRDATVKATVRVNRIEEPFKIILGSLYQYHNLMTVMGKELTPAQRQAVMKDWADFWWKFARADGQPLDEKAFREALVRKILEDSKPAEKPEDAKKK
jgi:polysaccharide export outer membrane protein